MWDPAQYVKFEEERTRPARDLAQAAALALGREPATVADLGCGPGNSTAVLAGLWPRASITGVDSSPEMIEKARADHPRGRGDRRGGWVVADAASWEPEGPLDLLFSNACI
jgi:trans-aconitate 2-methyltransferase